MVPVMMPMVITMDDFSHEPECPAINNRSERGQEIQKSKPEFKVLDADMDGMLGSCLFLMFSS
jgi:hypothetical protein